MSNHKKESPEKNKNIIEKLEITWNKFIKDHFQNIVQAQNSNFNFSKLQEVGKELEELISLLGQNQIIKSNSYKIDEIKSKFRNINSFIKEITKNKPQKNIDGVINDFKKIEKKFEKKIFPKVIQKVKNSFLDTKDKAAAKLTEAKDKAVTKLTKTKNKVANTLAKTNFSEKKGASELSKNLQGISFSSSSFNLKEERGSNVKKPNTTPNYRNKGAEEASR